MFSSYLLFFIAECVRCTCCCYGECSGRRCSSCTVWCLYCRHVVACVCSALHRTITVSVVCIQAYADVYFIEDLDACVFHYLTCFYRRFECSVMSTKIIFKSVVFNLASKVLLDFSRVKLYFNLTCGKDPMSLVTLAGISVASLEVRTHDFSHYFHEEISPTRVYRQSHYFFTS
jgi:hypothetical protein